MADRQQISILRSGVDHWIAWRRANPDAQVDLDRAHLEGMDLRKADLEGASLKHAHLEGADLREARLCRANLRWAHLRGAHLDGANLTKADLIGASMRGADLRGADLTEAKLGGAEAMRARLSGARLTKADLSRARLQMAHFEGADLSGAQLLLGHLINAHLSKADLSSATLAMADLCDADLRGTRLIRAILDGARMTNANLSAAHLQRARVVGAHMEQASLCGANLYEADLTRANLTRTDLTEANLTAAILVGASCIETSFVDATLDRCHVFGVSAWGVQLEGAKQTNLRITPTNQLEITVDNFEIAQFIYLLLQNDKIGEAINTITTKVVLILGRFTPERKAVLDALRETLRLHEYVPVLFDFKGPFWRTFTETITLLARMARFIIADVTDPASIPQELQAIVPNVHVPVRPIIADGATPYSMLTDFNVFPWMLEIYTYKDLDTLIANIETEIIAPAEAKLKALIP